MKTKKAVQEFLGRFFVFSQRNNHTNRAGGKGIDHFYEKVYRCILNCCYGSRYPVLESSFRGTI